MIKLNRGDPCRVRLHTGEVVEAVYDEPVKFSKFIPKGHWVVFRGRLYIAKRTIDDIDECRFVGNPCDLVPVGVSA